jgi:hypothetical protein
MEGLQQALGKEQLLPTQLISTAEERMRRKREESPMTVTA